MITLRALEAGNSAVGQAGHVRDAPADKRGITPPAAPHTRGFPALPPVADDRDASLATELLLGARLIAPPARACSTLRGLPARAAAGMLYGQASDLATQRCSGRSALRARGTCPKATTSPPPAQADGTLLRARCTRKTPFSGACAGNAAVFTADDLALFLRWLAADGRLPGARATFRATVRLSISNQTPELGTRAAGVDLPAARRGYTGICSRGKNVATGFTGASITLDPTDGHYVVC
jgi:hypothetical protein